MYSTQLGRVERPPSLSQKLSTSCVLIYHPLFSWSLPLCRTVLLATLSYTDHFISDYITFSWSSWVHVCPISNVGCLTFKITLLQVCLKMTEYLACPRYSRRCRQESDLWLEPEPADVCAQPRSPEGFLWGWLPGLPLCLCSCKRGGGGNYFTIVRAGKKFWVPSKPNNTTDVFSLSAPTRVSLLWTDDENWVLRSYLRRRQWTGALLRHEPQWCSQRRAVPSIMTQRALFRLLSAATLLGLFCFLQGRRGANWQ